MENKDKYQPIDQLKNDLYQLLGTFAHHHPTLVDEFDFTKFASTLEFIKTFDFDKRHKNDILKYKARISKAVHDSFYEQSFNLDELVTYFKDEMIQKHPALLDCRSLRFANYLDDKKGRVRLREEYKTGILEECKKILNHYSQKENNEQELFDLVISQFDIFLSEFINILVNADLKVLQEFFCKILLASFGNKTAQRIAIEEKDSQQEEQNHDEC